MNAKEKVVNLKIYFGGVPFSVTIPGEENGIKAKKFLNLTHK